jgi:hypothetical protein
MAMKILGTNPMRISNLVYERISLSQTPARFLKTLAL